MTELSIQDPCVLFALRREAGPFLREFRPHQRFPGAPFWARFAGPAWLTLLAVETGLGQERVEPALQWLLNRPMMGNLPYRPKVVLLAGFSGALRPGHRRGDLFLATEVVTPAGESWRTTWPGPLPPGAWRPPLYRDRILCVPDLALSAEDKRRLGEQAGAAAVDMESAIVARLCRQHDVPFGCLRVILDELETPLSPDLIQLVSGPSISLPRVALLLARRPGRIGELLRLSQASDQAARALSQGLGELLTLTLPWAGG